jgi:hypothetical protein
MGEKQFKEAEVKQIRTGRSELEEILVDTLTLKHPLSVHPEVDLISTEQERDIWEGKQIKIEVDRTAEKKGRGEPGESGL